VADEHVWVHGILDELETLVRASDEAARWDAKAWIGGDRNRLWLKSEAIVDDGDIGDGRHEALYSRAISTYFDLQVGARHDREDGEDRTWLAFGVQGLAPLFFDLEATAYASDAGHFAARFEGTYDLLLTQRLILQPKIEFELNSKSDRDLRIGSGLSSWQAGLRLRYEFHRKFAPYIGISYDSDVGKTASFAREDGERSREFSVVLGVRTWF
jgi:copper resistance protein B